MKRLYIPLTLLLFAALLTTSCEESRQNVSDKLNEINTKADEINSALDEGLEKVEALDSAVKSGAKQIKKYDSLVKKSSSELDSIRKAKAKALKDLTTF